MANTQYLATWSSLLLLLGAASACDFHRRRIPNWLVSVGLAVAFMGAALTQAGLLEHGLFLVDRLDPALLGAAVGLAAMLPFYAIAALGAGDAKLMATVGALIGPWAALGAALLTLACGGVLSLGVALYTRSLPRVMANLRLIALVALSGRAAGLGLRDVETTGRLPYALAIACGTGLQLLLTGHAAWPFQ